MTRSVFMQFRSQISTAVDANSADRTNDSHWRVRVFAVALSLLVLMTLLAKFVPWSPAMPSAGLDPSWRFGVNQAVEQGLIFGRDVVFTFGPYASIYTLIYSPATDWMALTGSIYLALSYWGIYTLFMDNSRWYLTVVFCLVLVSVLYVRDSLFFSLTLIIGLLSYKIIFTPDHFLLKSRFDWAIVALIFAPLGLLPLVKGSLWLMGVATIVLCATIFVLAKKNFLALCCFLAPLAMLVFSWIASGQSLFNLYEYFVSQSSIVSGYTEAMASGNNAKEIICFLVAAGLLLSSILGNAAASLRSRLFLFALYLCYLFIVFKAGFTRHDGHATIASTALVIGALFLPFMTGARHSVLVIFAAMLSWVVIDSNYIKTNSAGLIKNAGDAYFAGWAGARRRLQDHAWPKIDFDMEVKKMREQAAIPILPGTTDIYPTELSLLIASGNKWSPRPIFQSYSAYTPVLAEKNRQHLLGTSAPDNVLFEVASLDDRFPSLDDGPSWPVLLNNYRPDRMVNGVLILKKRPEQGAPVQALEIGRARHRLGELVILPNTKKILYAMMDIKPTLRGRIAGIFLKPNQLQITVKLKNGIESKYRIISGMAKAGFLLSPVVKNTAEFGLLYAGSNLLNSNLVQSIIIDTVDGNRSHWQEAYDLVLSTLPLQRKFDVSGLGLLNVFDEDLSSSATPTAVSCQGSIDLINGSAPLGEVGSSGSLKVEGWVAATSGQTSSSDRVYIVMTDNEKIHHFAVAKRTVRPDVAAYLKKPELANAGYVTNVDISKLKGKYNLGLAVENNGKIELCPQFSVPIRILD